MATPTATAISKSPCGTCYSCCCCNSALTALRKQTQHTVFVIYCAHTYRRFCLYRCVQKAILHEKSGVPQSTLNCHNSARPLLPEPKISAKCFPATLLYGNRVVLGIQKIIPRPLSVRNQYSTDGAHHENRKKMYPSRSYTGTGFRRPDCAVD